MDDLKFRRHAYADPNDQSVEFIEHLATHPQDAKRVNELKAFDEQINAALNVDVPNDLADKLLLRQQLTVHQAHKKRTRYLVTMAASIAFVVGISFSLLQLTPVNLSQQAIAHMNHEPKALMSDKDINYQDINFKLASIAGLKQNKFINQPGRVFYTTYCDFQGVKSLHLVMEDEHGKKVTLFIVPAETRMHLDAQFADEKYKGKGFESSDAYMLLVGEPDSDLEFVQHEIEHTFI
ncbi:DUF3379 domain-containing protein [Shewanella intestini]|uniref:DUF3379 family protein n=1 Tax=Shewanella intestini TaxID=2017544 RepID=A0ABS5I0L6_9GAMM|nr:MULTISPECIES: DUF3379 domain-containing protein [Shewanella]MBR9727461.1 DUF3379 family protein [Shewanella intestini]MRG35489.1 DUF3379 family protein [Shewanella sp. XMDDZSB0408]